MIVMKKQSGFTIVELLIVIVVIAILATITIVAFSGIQERARQAKVKQDIAAIHKAVKLAHESTGKSILELSGNLSYGTGGSAAACSNVHPTGTDMAALDKNDGCWRSYNKILSTISDASGSDIRNIIDPWGRPYIIMEWEMPNNCRTDQVGAMTNPYDRWSRLANSMTNISRRTPGVGC